MLGYPSHAALQHYVAALNQFYLQNPPLYERDADWSGFAWIDADNAEQGVLSYRRIDARGREIVVILNLTPVKRENFRIGVPLHGEWREVFNSDLAEYGGENTRNEGVLRSEKIAWHGFSQSVSLTLPPMGAIFLKVAKRYEKTAKNKQESNKEVRK